MWLPRKLPQQCAIVRNYEAQSDNNFCYKKLFAKETNLFSCFVTRLNIILRYPSVRAGSKMTGEINEINVCELKRTLFLI